MKKITLKESSKELRNRIHHLEFKLAQHEEAQSHATPYNNKNEIIEALSELSVGIDTYEFLSELFFNFLANEVRTTSPSEERLNLYINTRHEIHQLYELARAAKMLRMKMVNK
ncbi:hypothetical protein [Ohtaekwangia koreensis]|uniref:Uncharacterized protein n=1 Tax=Ohtaekwangia koreensis TaxID=688867 RepID=A0A1T5LD13_9BACT|nr:hypothetical protein [Ohtaekwangia koreensis]SKC73595.1 hypothetical protein SAMN05660236_2951 [Ohtaekwangia koreensis]